MLFHLKDLADALNDGECPQTGTHRVEGHAVNSHEQEENHRKQGKAVTKRQLVAAAPLEDEDREDAQEAEVLEDTEA